VKDLRLDVRFCVFLDVTKSYLGWRRVLLGWTEVDGLMVGRGRGRVGMRVRMGMCDWLID